MALGFRLRVEKEGKVAEGRTEGVLGRHTREGLRLAVAFGQRQVAAQAFGKDAVFSRTFVGSIRGEVVGPFGNVTSGIIGSPLPYALVLEEGRRAGRRFPPPEPIARWVRRKLGVPEEKVRGVAFVVARKIARRGTRPRHIFRDARPAIQRAAAQFLDRAVSDATEELSR